MGNAFEVSVELREFVDRRIRTLGLNIHSNLVSTTPVDTGWARSNWITGVGQAPQNTPGNQSTHAILNYRLEQGSLYIVNNVNYIERLNADSSKYAGFVQIAIQKAIAGLKS